MGAPRSIGRSTTVEKGGEGGRENEEKGAERRVVERGEKGLKALKGRERNRGREGRKEKSSREAVGSKLLT